jgi:4-methylaminobutanoate oxidase (formaldehyde-forming)
MKVASAEVVVIGGGAIGCSAAYHLAAAGVHPVIVLERGALASGATSRAAALLTQVRAKTEQIALVQRTYAAIREIQGELGDSLGFQRTGSLHIAGSSRAYVDLVHLQRSADCLKIPTLWLQPSSAQEMLPWLKARQICGVLFTPDDAIVDPYLLAHGYARAARARGVTIETRAEVTGLLCRGTTVEGVQTHGGDISARWVVDATGAWAGLLARGAGVRLPLAPVRSHYWITAPEPEYPRCMPYAVLPDAHAYIRPEGGSLIVGLRERESLSVDPRTIPADLTGVAFGDEGEGQQMLIEGRDRLRPFFPGLDNTRFVKFVTGLSTYAPDGQFVLGTVSGMQGYLVASGCCGAGIAASGGFGAAVAALATGQASPWELQPFSPDRFGAVDPFTEEFRARCAAARSAKSSG